VSIRLVKLFVAAIALLISCYPANAQQAAAKTAPWGYAGSDGPDHWGDLDAAYAACKTGQHQSPLDIDDPVVEQNLAPIRFDYKLSPLKIVNTGETIRIDYQKGSSIIINGVSLPLVQFHFHHPSETEINGRKYDMELHLVHQDAAAGRTAVVSILIKNGSESALLRDLLAHAPRKPNGAADLKKIVINAADFLPSDQNYYVFDGSLTTPPCSENVKWYVLKTPIEASAAQIEAFAKLYPDNARPVQPLNGRTVLESDFKK
jgi:carbonic anhydrase